MSLPPSRTPSVDRLLALALASLLGATSPAASEDTPLFIELPTEALAYGVGAGGFTVIGGFYSGGGLYWMPTTGVRMLGGQVAVAISDDGRTIVGDALDATGFEQAAVWLEGGEPRLLGSIAPDARPCDLLLSSAFDVNADGSVVVGLAWNGCGVARAFRWEESTGVVDLGTLTGESTRANGVSGDGRVVVGWEEDHTGPRLGAKWVDGRQEMIRGPLGPVGEAHAANSDGSIIVGGRCGLGGLGPPTAWTWTPEDGVRCFPVEVPPDVPDHPYGALMFATSEQGRVIGGALSFGLDSEAVVWFDGEPVFLKDYLRANGVPDAFRGWINTGFVNGVSSDGRVLVGYGAAPRGFTGYVVVLPEGEDE